MRIANIDGRLKLLIGTGAVDVEHASGSRFSADPQAAYEDFESLRAWAETVTESTEPFEPERAGPPVPAPRQVFAIGLNYREHAAEAGEAAPDKPIVFTKYISSFSGPVTEVELPSGAVDWEVELVAVIGKTARNVSAEHGWDYVAGLTVGQDISERALQMHGGSPQWSLAKSLPGFSPMGAVLVTPDELPDCNNLHIGCAINGEVVQDSRTSLMIYPVPDLIAYLSGLVTLYPGDVIFTGTPSGVGVARKPPRFLRVGEHLRSWVEHIGTLDQRLVASKSIGA
ncbi:fumarylacetoacetate hydrolase family protein [[Mycobacterium] burgundiense]|uniref:Fumarylacetoacetate hydrolase family protein n=1 Tax=[Mycobacterium] burgundiense TaxID=3064286 RepID=A0ABM9M4A1_9MYCO|nr:fumarylacetoacetate hydrolase family protein [Mycolicibacterium sp. MU0053]CAJ1509976.1 fumarylacetoacetate hydrolase family protein [Mycolicibacterium sp. MU0053]